MAKNREPGRGRKGAVRSREQIKLKKGWMKRDSVTKRFLGIKADGSLWKGVRKA